MGRRFAQQQAPAVRASKKQRTDSNRRKSLRSLFCIGILGGKGPNSALVNGARTFASTSDVLTARAARVSWGLARINLFYCRQKFLITFDSKVRLEYLRCAHRLSRLSFEGVYAGKLFILFIF